MNPRIEKLCLPRHRRDALWKFWQPNAKLEKIHPPIYWKSLDYKPINTRTKTSVQESHQKERSCSDGCHYTTLIGKEFRVFVDYEHEGLGHATWKESIEPKPVRIKSELSIGESPWLNLNNKQQSLNDRYLIRQELHRYFKSHIQRDYLFQLDRSSYPNRPMPLSRRPRDALHIDFYQANHLKGSKIEATFKTFYHRKYLIPRSLREQTLKDLLSIAIDIQLDMKILGHLILHPNELSKHEIEMFGLTSAFGDIYEGHIIRINQEKLVLLLASAHHSHIQLSQSENLGNIPDEPKSTIEEIILKHAREYLQIHTNHSMKQIRRIQIELEPLINEEKRRVILHLLSDDEMIDTLDYEITFEQEPKLFQKEYEDRLYFLQSIDEQSTIHTVENQLKQLFSKRYSLAHQEEKLDFKSTLDMEYQTMNSIEKMLDAYANGRLARYSREECMRIAIEYSFDDLLDQLDFNEVQWRNNSEQRKMIVDDIQMRLREQIERRLKAETTAMILLVGPVMKREIECTGKEVIVLDHHREIFVTRSDTPTGSSKVKDMQRNHGHVIFHEEIEGGPKSFDRLPMSIDSLTILTRIQQRKRLAAEEDENRLVQLGSGIRRLVTFEDQEEDNPLSVECEQDKIEKLPSSHLSFDEDDDHSMRTTLMSTKSYNTSAHTRPKGVQEFPKVNHQRKKKKKRVSRSPAEYGKHRQKRKKYKRNDTASESFDENIDSKRSFFNRLFLLRRNRDLKGKYIRSSKPVNTNAITEDSNMSKDRKMNLDERVEENGEQASTSSEPIRNEMDVLSHKDEEHQESHHSDKPLEQQPLQDEGFQDNEEFDDDDNLEAIKKNHVTERYLRSLYGSLSSTMKHAYDIYQSKSSQLMASLDLAHIFITFLHMRKDIAYEIASTIIAARQRLIQPISTQKSSSNTMIDGSIGSNTHSSEGNDFDEDDDASASSGMISENSITARSISDDFPIIDSKKESNPKPNKDTYSSSSQLMMSRITAYLSEADWRVYNYITKYFLQNGSLITRHALEFSSALLIDLIEDSIYRTYFHLKWCPDSTVNLNDTQTNEYVKETLIEQFFQKSIDNLLNHLQLINLPLLESIALVHTLKKYMNTDVLEEFISMEHHPVPMGRDPCIWFSTDILIKTICSLTDDILKKMNDDYLSDYTKFEYLLISYFRKIEIVQNLQQTIERKQSEMSSHTKSHSRRLLHVIDLNQAPKFFTDQAFKRFKVDEKSDLNGNVEALKDLVLLDIQKRNVKAVKRPYLPLSMDDLVVHHQNRAISPSPWVIAQYQRRWDAHKIRLNQYNMRKDSYQFDETAGATKLDHLPPEVRALFENMIRSYGTVEGNLAIRATQDQYEGLSEEDVARMIENAIEAVEKFDRENNIGDRKLQNKKTVNDRLAEFFKHAGRHGVRLLDDVLKMAKLRSDDPEKYLPLAVNMFRDRLKQSTDARTRKQGVRFAHTLETLLTATNDEPELIATLLKKKSERKSSKPVTPGSKSPRKRTEEILESADIASTESVTDTNIPSYLRKESSIDKYRQTLPMIEEAVEPTNLSSGTTRISDEFQSEVLLSNAVISQISLTVAQMVVLATVQSRKPLKLTDTQIKQ